MLQAFRFRRQRRRIVLAAATALAAFGLGCTLRLCLGFLAGVEESQTALAMDALHNANRSLGGQPLPHHW